MKLKLPLFLALIFGFTTLLQAQNSDDFIIKINDQKVSSKDFIDNYKYNQNQLNQDSTESIESYLALFIRFKTKLYQAHLMGLDTSKSYFEEVKYYRDILSEKYFKDQKATNRLIKEAFDRYQSDLSVSHILFGFGENIGEKQLKDAEKLAFKVRNEIIDGKITFEEAAKKYSKDPSAAKNSGNLGWMTTFTMVYPFETAAYSLVEGEISQPVKTQFGYHLIKLNEKVKSHGKINMSVLVKLKTPNDSINRLNESLLRDVKKRVEAGENFADLVRMYSDDKQSAMNGGKFPEMAFGKLSEPLNSIAFALKEGEVSDIINGPNASYLIYMNNKSFYNDFEKEKDKLTAEFNSDRRFEYISKGVADSLRNAFKLRYKKKDFEKLNKELFENFKNQNLDDFKISKNKILISVNTIEYDINEYLQFLKENPIKTDEKRYKLDFVLNKRIDEFIDYCVLDYYDKNLENLHPEFKFLMNNYREGILIFNLMNKKVFERVELDTLGLKDYFDKNKKSYTWPQRADVELVSLFDCSLSKKVHKYLKRGKDQKYLEDKYNKDNQIKLLFKKGLVTKNNIIFEDNFFWELGVSKVFKGKDNNCQIFRINKFVDPTTKSFKEAIKEVKIDYQASLEKNWEEEISNDYDIEINQEVLSKIKNEIYK